ncbi:MAG: hypothetical protein ACRCT8_03725 [Lacipirellulaceae bacterium]
MQRTSRRNYRLGRLTAQRRGAVQRHGATQRRGVLLLVVLSMLVLFLLLGTTFLITSSQYRAASRAVEKAGRATFQPEDVLERALMQLLRDTNNAHSAARYHSLLRDLYGADGFVGRVFVPTGNLASGQAARRLLPHCAGANVNATQLDLGPTSGQLVDLFVVDVEDRGAGAAGRLRDNAVVGLDFDEAGIPVEHTLSQNDAYYEGCLLTMLDGPCRGQSVRVVDYDHETTVVSAGGVVTTTSRFRVMAPGRLDGSGLRARAGFATLQDFFEWNDANNNNNVDLTPVSEVRTYRFLINGRPFNGTGVGFSAAAASPDPRLSALEVIQDAASGSWFGLEQALIPNATTFTPNRAGFLDPGRRRDPDGAGPLIAAEPFTAGLTGFAPTTDFRRLNPSVPAVPGEPVAPLYPAYPGPGDTDEGYDAADFQNMFLASQAPERRARGRVVDPTSGASVDPEVHYTPSSPASPARLDLEGLPVPSFHRPALANYWFHRLWNSAWLQAAVGDPQDRARAILQPYNAAGAPQFGMSAAAAAQVVAIKRKFMMRPLREDHPAFDGSNPLSRYASTAANLATGGRLVNDRGTGATDDDDITFPFWEATGPWDVDNDNDGVPDSVWVDLGLAVQKTEDGRFYKPLVAMLVEDLDGRLNLNAHGTVEHFANDQLDRSTIRGGAIGANLALDQVRLVNAVGARRRFDTFLRTTDQLPPGEGWGPADITLRSILSPNLPTIDAVRELNGQTAPWFVGYSQYDDYARLLAGRPSPSVGSPDTSRGAAPRSVSPVVDVAVTWGRYGSYPGSLPVNPSVRPLYRPGRSFDSTALSTLDPLWRFDFAGWPQFAPTVGQELLNTTTGVQRSNLLLLGVGGPSGFAELPDLKGRYAKGVSAVGQSIFEAERDFTAAGAVPLTADSPYELDLSSAGRRRRPEDLSAVVASYTGTAPINDDAPFSAAELERLLRALDADAGRLPNRLWDLTDAFDPQKLAVQNAIADGVIVDPDNFPGFNATSLQRVVAQSQAAINRRSVTTDSWDLPVPNENWTARCLLGADGLPGVPYVNDDGDRDVNNNPVIDEGDETGSGTFAAGSDDYQVVMGELPPSGARITDYLRYRVTLELRRQGVAVTPDRLNNILFGRNDIAAAAARADRYSYGGLLAPEVLAGRKMDLNRPFGDGKDNGDRFDTPAPPTGRPGSPAGNGVIDDAEELRDGFDNNGDGVIDEPAEGYDAFMNGVVDEPAEAGEPYVDSDASGRWELGEPYIDRNNDGAYSTPLNAPIDVLWASDVNGNGQLDAGEYAEFDHTNGQNIAGPYRDPQMARQLYARHLYCLMLTVMDENYLAPFDDNDPQTRHYLDPRSGRLQGGTPTLDSSEAFKIAFALGGATPTIDQQTEARRRALRKLTCRQVAQWAINAADMRDPDSIQTPFEYDENPWDGWNVVDTKGTTAVNDDSILPLDGDVSTDENLTVFRDLTVPALTVSPPVVVPAHLQTRGLVWGAERPELLLTEGLALHNRNLQDLGDLGAYPPDGKTIEAPSKDNPDPDDDLDQQRRPEGSCFVEVYNPWSPDSATPAELYREPGGAARLVRAALVRTADVPALGGVDPQNDGGFVEGVLLDRVSNLSVPVAGGRLESSPVWRMACVEQHPQLRNTTIPAPLASGATRPEEFAEDDGLVADRTYFADTPSLYAGTTYAPQAKTQPLLKAYAEYSESLRSRSVNEFSKYKSETGITGPPERVATARPRMFEVPAPTPVDPDFPAFNPTAQPQRVGAGQIARVTPSNPNYLFSQYNRERLLRPEAYYERMFYFTSGARGTVHPFLGPVRDIVTPGVRVPELFYDVELSNPKAVQWLRVEGAKPATDAKKQFDLRSYGLDVITSKSPPRLRVHANRFAPLNLLDADGSGADDSDNLLKSVPLAPILPGRYGVIATADKVFELGASPAPAPATTRVTTQASLATLTDRYATIVSALAGGPSGTATPIPTRAELAKGRRFELFPSVNPHVNQFAVRFNATTETKELPPGSPKVQRAYGESLAAALIVDQADRSAAGNDLWNLYDLADNFVDRRVPFPVRTDTSRRDRLIQPIVAIPMEGFSVSTPLDNYVVRQAELDPGMTNLVYDPNAKRKDGPNGLPGGGYTGTPGSLSSQVYSDEPFDVLPELLRNQTSPNYRTMVLQRLANPLLPWNPPPLRADGTVDPQHVASFAVNPYLSVDSLPIDLTAYNGTDVEEDARTPGAGEKNAAPAAADSVSALYQQPRALPASVPGGVASKVLEGVLTFRSTERGEVSLYVSEASLLGAAGRPEVMVPGVPTNEFWSDATPTTSVRLLVDEARLRLTGADLAAATGAAPQTADGSARPQMVSYAVRHSLGMSNHFNMAMGTYEDPVGSRAYKMAFGLYQGSDGSNTVDLNGDTVVGDMIGARRLTRADNEPRDGFNVATGMLEPRLRDGVPDFAQSMQNDNSPPALHWPNRPFVSEGELLQVPCWSSSRLLTYYSTFNPNRENQPNQYDGSALATASDPPGPAADISVADPVNTNRERWRRMHATFGHLLNFFASAPLPARSVPTTTGDVTAYGAPHFYRILDYVHTPSRFVATDTLLTPAQFGAGAVAPNDPRRELLAPFNRVDNYREPGKVNLNTVVGRRDVPQVNPLSSWSEVYDGLMHRVKDRPRLADQNADGVFDSIVQDGHLGPAWRDVVLSRRGYTRPTPLPLPSPPPSAYGVTSPAELHRDFPTEVANPFRDASAGDLVPLAQLVRNGVETSRVRPHPFLPGADSAWGRRGADDGPSVSTNPLAGRLLDSDASGTADLGDGMMDDPSEAGRTGTDDRSLFETATGRPIATTNLAATGAGLRDIPFPLFSGALLEPSLDTDRNPQFRYGPIARLANLTSNRSGVFAVWITVGFFEVTPVNAQDHPAIWSRYGLGVPDAADPAQLELTRQFFQVYQDGYTLGQELGLDTGESRRHRGFYLIDRTLPVGFKPGDDVNVDKAILVRRRIE